MLELRIGIAIGEGEREDWRTAQVSLRDAYDVM